MIYAVGWLVGWPALMFLIAEPLRNLGKYSFADVVASRLKKGPIKTASAVTGLMVVISYTIAQMVGSGKLIELMFGIPYTMAEIIVGTVMLMYVIFGGMLATTWVQIIKACPSSLRCYSAYNSCTLEVRLPPRKPLCRC